jgi:transposase
VFRGHLRESQVEPSEADGLQFVPAVVDVASSAPTVCRQRKAPTCEAEPGSGTIEVEIDGVTIRVARGADVKTVRAVLRALKAGV